MINSNKVRVMVVDDSLVFRRFLIDNLPKAQPRIEIVGYAVDPIDAMKKIPELKPQVITMDIEMPKMNGIEFVKNYLPKYPLPIILSSTLDVSVFDALSYGAVDFVRKPDMTETRATEGYVKHLAAKVVGAANAKVRIPPASIRAAELKGIIPPANGAKAAPKTGGATAMRTGNTAASARTGGVTGNKMAPVGVIKIVTTAKLKLDNTVIAIGASTGGTEATLEVIKKLPADIPGMVITQHMPAGFTKMYADRLNKICQMEVREAKDGDIIKRGLALIAPGDLQMRVVKKGINYIVACKPGEKVSGHRPSVDVLFESVANSVGRDAIGMILTGMGQDGAAGLLKMRKNGAYTFGQDRDSSVVYGMPKVAYDIGAVCMQSSCMAMAGSLMKYLNSF